MNALDQFGTLIDRYGRRITYLRISVIDRCDLRCLYCLPARRNRAVSRDRLLRTPEIVEVAAAARDLGITKLRLTGGEPLMRPEVVAITRALASVDGITTLSMTTNGSRLDALASRLRAVGLSRVNVSLDSLNPDTYRRITRGGDLDAAIAGIRAARAVGLPVKVNAVLLREVNDVEIEDFVAFARREGVEVRFIEEMSDDDRPYVPEDRVLEALRRRHRVVPLADDREATHVRRVSCGGAVIGFISSRSRRFCGACNRLRLTSTGEIRSCLSAPAHVNIRRVLRAPHTPREVRRALEQAAWLKPAVGPRTRPEMRRIGG